MIDDDNLRMRIALAVLLGMCLAALVSGCDRAKPSTGKALPSKLKHAGFAGTRSCRSCHEPFFKLWVSSRHGLAMQPFTAKLAKDELTDSKDGIAISNHKFTFELKGEKGFVIEVGPEGKNEYEMVHALGGKNVYYFLTPMARGRLQVLPIAYDVRKKEWFDTTLSAARHFKDIENEVLSWLATPLTFNTSCYSCHVSQLTTNYDLKSDTYKTVWKETGINCETCHGPSEEHIRVCTRAKKNRVPKDLKIIRGGRQFSHDQNNWACASCHAKMIPITTSFKPGDRFFDHYDLMTLEDRDFYPDGRDLGENYTYTLWKMSPCAKSGNLDCLHCHTSSGRYLHEKDPNRSCLPCHERRVNNPTAHTFHQANGSGSRCIECHMPKTEFARMRRSDHSMLPPAPAATIAFKSPNACNNCHFDKNAAWADELVRKWRPRDFQAPILHRAKLVEAARKQDWSRLDEMLSYINRKDRDEVFATSLLKLLNGCEDERKWPTLLEALEDPSPMIRGSAASALAGHLTPQAVSALVKATHDSYRLVRIRAASALATLPPSRLHDEEMRKSLVSATAELMGSMKARPDDFISHYNLGNFHMDRREYSFAISSYETSIKLRPDNIAPYINVSFAYNHLGDSKKAEQNLKKVLEIDVENLAANLNLGMLVSGQGRLAEAASYFSKALKTDPNSHIAAYNLCVIAGKTGRIKEAIDWCKKARSLSPDNPKYSRALDYYRAGDSRHIYRVRGF